MTIVSQILSTAHDGHAGIIATGDKHLLGPKNFRKLVSKLRMLSNAL